MSGLPPLTVKQVIVMRKDLGMRKGKMVAQGAHASLAAILNLQKNVHEYAKRHREALDAWLNGTFSKICVGVDSGDELLRIRDAALDAGLPVKLITDAGHTEFHGVPTITCLAIGPCWVEDVDPVTGGLKLL